MPDVASETAVYRSESRADIGFDSGRVRLSRKLRTVPSNPNKLGASLLHMLVEER